MSEDFKNIDTQFLVGMAATIIGIIRFWPIVYKVWKTGHTKNFPYLALFLALLSNALWVWYGTFETTWANIIAGSIFFCIYLYILFVKIKN